MSRPHDPSINRRQILTLTAMTLAVPTWAQTGYPSKPITMLVPFPAGGTTDILGRLVGRHLATRLGGTVVVENLSLIHI